MLLRKEIEPKLSIAAETYPIILKLIHQWDEAYDADQMDKLDYFVAKINAVSQVPVDKTMLWEYWEGDPAEAYAFRWSLPDPKKVDTISREELCELIRRIRADYFEPEVELFENLPGEELKEDILYFSSFLIHSYYIPFIALNFELDRVKVFQLLCCDLEKENKRELSLSEYADRIYAMPRQKKKIKNI